MQMEARMVTASPSYNVFFKRTSKSIARQRCLLNAMHIPTSNFLQVELTCGIRRRSAPKGQPTSVRRWRRDKSQRCQTWPAGFYTGTEKLSPENIRYYFIAISPNVTQLCWNCISKKQRTLHKSCTGVVSPAILGMEVGAKRGWMLTCFGHNVFGSAITKYLKIPENTKGGTKFICAGVLPHSTVFIVAIETPQERRAIIFGFYLFWQNWSVCCWHRSAKSAVMCSQKPPSEALPLKIWFPSPGTTPPWGESGHLSHP